MKKLLTTVLILATFNANANCTFKGVEFNAVQQRNMQLIKDLSLNNNYQFSALALSQAYIDSKLYKSASIPGSYDYIPSISYEHYIDTMYVLGVKDKEKEAPLNAVFIYNGANEHKTSAVVRMKPYFNDLINDSDCLK